MKPGIEQLGNSVIKTALTRRGFVKIGGALFVSLAVPAEHLVRAQDNQRSPDLANLSPLASWLEVRNDNTILVRTGRTEIGTGMSAFYAQTVAEELRVKPEAITLLMGDTDRTPDGGYSAGFLSGASNVRKVSAYTYQALLGLAATRLGISASDLSVNDGVVSGGGKNLSYGQLVEGQQLDLKIPSWASPQGLLRPAATAWLVSIGRAWTGLSSPAIRRSNR